MKETTMMNSVRFPRNRAVPTRLVRPVGSGSPGPQRGPRPGGTVIYSVAWIEDLSQQL